ncbi:heme biosynthesis protein HemY [Xanthobacter dioxanivorans]|uniref:Heme biosynthesis protein HemY n=1 Tax=Xanthobacter dioxanivorans TaxID=2528964 RepID=A0A974PMY0_9HYPH|nr:heme biosynthesis HemY N-terminal domain-containing protein [Xanthobacter dioxanivorans]QRG06495.1 heme biosynthesis protein HemY [Xanthobacter dioxanivorans]
MIRLVLFLLVLVAIAFGASWLADRPGEIAVVWQGWRVETTVPVALAVFAVITGLLLLLWRLLSVLVRSPKLLAAFSRRRRREKGWNAVSRGLLAVGIGDHAAVRHARAEAVKFLPHEPLTHLLTAQAAQLDNNHEVAVAAFRAMVDDPATRLLGLRGLHMEARKAGDKVAAYAIAEEAAASAPALGWAAEAVIEARCAGGDYAGARAILERQMAHKGIDKAQYRRRKAVLLAAEAIALEQSDPPVARERAVEAVRLAPTLVPAAACAGRLLGADGELRKAARIVETAFAASPHPELADVEAYLRPGDAAQDRLKRIRALVNRAPAHRESAIALARAAIDAQEFKQARMVLEPLLAEPSQRICLLMAELEAAEHADIGKAREWTARAVRANRDPAWIADGVVSDRWAAISPVTGRLDVFVWDVPPGVSATPILEHEAERVKAAIAAVRASEEAKAAEQAAALSLAAERAAARTLAAGQAEAIAEAEEAGITAPEMPKPPMAQKAAEAAPVVVEIVPPASPPAAPVSAASPAPAAFADRSRSPRPDPIVALPPLPDDPGPEPEEPDAAGNGKKRRLMGL